MIGRRATRFRAVLQTLGLRGSAEANQLIGSLQQVFQDTRPFARAEAGSSLLMVDPRFITLRNLFLGIMSRSDPAEPRLVRWLTEIGQILEVIRATPDDPRIDQRVGAIIAEVDWHLPPYGGYPWLTRANLAYGAGALLLGFMAAGIYRSA